MAFAYETDTTKAYLLQKDVLVESTSANPNMKTSPIVSLNKAFNTTSKSVVGAVNELLKSINDANTVNSQKVNGVLDVLGDYIKHPELLNELQSSNTNLLSKVTQVSSSVANIQSAIDNGTIGSSNGSMFVDEQAIATDGSTTITLKKVPVDAECMMFYINGIMYSRLRKDYSYDAATNTITWLRTVASGAKFGFDLATTDYVTTVYFVKETKTQA